MLTRSQPCSHLRQMKNLLTDIAGVSVGHADDTALASGVTAIIFDKPAVTSIDVRGGGPGTREDALLDPVSTVDAIDAITLAGGSAFGLEGGGGVPPSFTPDMLRLRIKGGLEATAVENTTLVAVVTDAILTKPQAKRLAMIAQTGMARAIYPVHAPLDGDVVFAAATGAKPIDPLFGLTELGMVAANVVARAIARGVYQATALPFPDALPAWGDRF